MKSTYTFRFIFSFFVLSIADALHAQTDVVRINMVDYSSAGRRQTYTVPAGGPFRYRITVVGGNGGAGRPNNDDLTYRGRGGYFASEFNLASGTVLDCVAGSNGKTPTQKPMSGGGGGASGVYVVGVGPLIVAGGGGGASSVFVTCGGINAKSYSESGNTAGVGGDSPPRDYAGAGGGGIIGNGGSNTRQTTVALGGGRYLDGGNAYLDYSNNAGGGGFAGGGGGSTYNTERHSGGGGGGGGYNGGAGGSADGSFASPAQTIFGVCGQGGTSFVSTWGYNTSPFYLIEDNSNGGSVRIEMWDDRRYSDFGTLIPRGMSDDLLFEFNQLEAFYRATNGANWNNKANWLTGADMSTWAGVTLTSDGKSVLKIELPSNNLTGGNIPDLNLPFLTTLNLGDNKITGAIPNFNYLPAIETLSLNTNQFSGSVPLFNNCPALSRLNLAINKLTGAVPNFTGNNWLHIDLGLNQLTGSLPRLGLLYLRFFSVYGNKLTGFPDYFFLPYGQTDFTFIIENNNFSGRFPPVYSYYGYVITLQNLYMRNNKFNFGDLIGQQFLASTGTIAYAPQQKIGITNNNGALEVNTGIPNTPDTQDFYWYKDSVVVAVTNTNFYRPTTTGVYRCEVSHNTLTDFTSAAKTLILVSNNITVSTILKSNGGRNLPADLPGCLTDDFNELEKIYDATAGSSWTNRTNWLTSGNIASWYGVWGMSADGCNVADLVLNSNNLNGVLPALTFPSATRLSFADNLLRGSVPTITAPNLTILGLGSNQLSGNIPNFSFSLNELYLNNNQFTFADMVGKTWLSTPAIWYAPQANRTLTLNSNCTLSVDVSASVAGQIILWYKDGVEVARGSSNQYTPSVSGVYSVQVHHDPLTQYSNPVRALILSANVVNINFNPASSISIVASPSTAINRGNLVTFTATATNVGANPTYQWQVNGVNVGTNSTTYSSTTYSSTTLNEGDVVRCLMTPSEVCAFTRTATSNSLTITVACPTRLYVKTVSSGLGDGSSWDNATSDLQAALNNPCNTQEIWVAKGTYYPTRDEQGNPNSYILFRVFTVPNGRMLYGGFAGTETSLSQRTAAVMQANPTILSGDPFDNDIVTGTGGSLSFINYLNNYHVVAFYGLTAPTRLDGFTVTAGNALTPTLYSPGYIHFDPNRNSGGGIWNVNTGSNVTIANCIITKNMGVSGGGMVNSNASPTLINCVFDRNRASAGHGGGMINVTNSRAQLRNCVVSGNTAPSGVGGGITNFSGSAINVVNSTVSGNYAVAGGGIYNDNSNATLSNTIVWGNAVDGLANYQSTATVNYSVLQASHAGTGNLTTNPNFNNANNPVGADGIWMTADDGLRLGCISPAWNTGNNADAPATDILGVSRPQGSVADIGAYEATQDLTTFTASIAQTGTSCTSRTFAVTTTPPLEVGGLYAWSSGATPSLATNTFVTSGTYTVTVTNPNSCTVVQSVTANIPPLPTRLYVNANNTNPSPDGLTWATAFNNLQSALSACKTSGAEIWVARGTYKPSVDYAGNSNPSNLRTRTFFVQGDVNIYGGFAGTEATLSERTPSVIRANPTVLSGDFNGDDTQSGNGNGLVINNLTENAYHVVNFAGTPSIASRLDGFQIRGGNANYGADYYDYGGGVYTSSVGNKLTVANCFFQFNGGYYGGGMANNFGASPIVQNCVFDRNFALLHGGAVANYDNSAPTFNNCVITGNYALNVAGGVYNRGTCNAVFNNTTIVGNAAGDANGGAIYNDGSFPTISNAIIWANLPANPFNSFNGGAPTVNFSIIQSGQAGTSNTNADPIFTNIADPDGSDNQWFTTDDGLQLACGSPAYNTGTTTSLTTDILGNNRTQFTTTDRGAYESTTNLTSPTITILGATTACSSTTLTASGGSTYAWSGGSTPSVSSNTFTTSGTYTVTVTSAASCSATQSVTVVIESLARIYVNAANANTTKDGKTWATAFDNLQTAFETCLATNGEIWVAKGTYKPTKDPFGNANPTNNRDKTFYLRNGLKLYGGFAGTEGVLSEHNWVTNPTILSGDFNGNDNGFSNNGENAYHVVASVSDDNTTVLDGFIVQSGNANGTATVSIESKNVSRGSGGGLYNHTSSPTVTNCIFANNVSSLGGALFNEAASMPQISRSVFHTNQAAYGGAVFNATNSAPTFTNIVAHNNTALALGGGFYNQAASPTFITSTLNNSGIHNEQSLLAMTNCIIWGVGIVNPNGLINLTSCITPTAVGGSTNSTANPQFVNVADPDGADNQWFTSDDGLQLGCQSPAYNTGLDIGVPATDILGNARPQFSNVDRGAYESTVDLSAPTVTITGATTACEAATLTASGGSTYAWSGGSTPSVTSNIFTTNGTYTVTVTNANGCTASASRAITIFSRVLPTVTIQRSSLGLVAADTLLTFTATPTFGGPTPQYQWYLNNAPVGTNAATYQSNSLANGDVVRCQLTSNYECLTTNQASSNSLTVKTCLASSTRLYVKPVASGTGDGSSWANATNDLQEVINNGCGITEIWVATGVYKPRYDVFGNATPTDLRLRTFNLRNNVRLYGGFAGTETDLSQRTPSVFAANSTILSGDFNDNDVTTGANSTLTTTNNGENAYHVAVAAGSDVANLIDGFTIRSGNANAAGSFVLNGQTLYNNSGGGLYQVGCSVAVSNVVFQANCAGFGAGLYCFTASPVVTNSIFDRNRTSSHGAAGLNILSAAPVYNNCVFSNGRADGVGGAFYNLLGAAATFRNCTFFSNYAVATGGVIYNDGSSSTITNSIVWSNLNSGNFGAFNGGTATVTYSTVEGGQLGTGNSSTNPQFTNSSNPIGADNQWFTADDGLQLQNTSPARDAGTNTGVPTLDILGVNVFNTTKDMGAYEFQEDIYAGSATCQNVSIANVMGNQWFYFRHNNTIVAAINPNGMNLGTVTASISDPTGTVNFDNSKFIGRTINFTSSAYADGVTMPNTYTLRLYYADGEITEVNQASGGSATPVSFNMAWQQGTSGCTLSAAANVGIILKSNITTGEYGPNNNGFFLQFPLNHFTVFAPTTSGSTVLPVELLNFSGYTEGGNNLLVWTTANELNNKGFNVERLNPNCKDTWPCVSTWKSLGFVPTKGKAGIYDFTDKTPLSISYYRLRQMDNDGKETLSKVISLSNITKSFLKVYPNPTTDVLTVEWTKGVGTTDKATTFEVINLLGQIILRGPLNQSVDLSALPNGTYSVRVGLEQVKFVKQ